MEACTAPVMVVAFSSQRSLTSRRQRLPCKRSVQGEVCFHGKFGRWNMEYGSLALEKGARTLLAV